jgi:RNA-binding protein
LQRTGGGGWKNKGSSFLTEFSRIIERTDPKTEVYVEKLKGYQKKYLKGLVHGMKPLVFVGQKGLSPTVTKAVDESLEKYELIKVKFIDFKEKGQKKEIAGAIEEETASELVGMIGHIAIFYRQQKDPEKRKINVPKR